MFIFVILILAAVLILSRALNQDHTVNQEKPKKADSWKGAFVVYGKAWDGLQKNPRPAVLFVATYAVAQLVSTVLQGKGPMQIGHVGFESAVGLLFIMAAPIYSLAIADGRKISIREFMVFVPKKYFMIILATILLVLIALLSFIPLAIPLIWTYAWFFATTYAIVDKDLSPFKALQYSKSLAENHKSKFWGLMGANILFGLGAAPLMLLSMAFAPNVGFYAVQLFLLPLSLVSSAATAILYRWLQKEARSK